MTRAQRKLLVRIGALGTLLTLFVVLIDGLDRLEPLERYLYDLRARQCQYYSPPPSDKIVHVDIDDQSLQEIGRWPWPRRTLAQLIDEMNAAGAKVIALDILLTQPQQAEAVRDGADQIRLIDHDQILADTIKRCGNVLVPITQDLRPMEEQTPVYRAMVRELARDLELDAPELEETLRAEGFGQADLRTAIRSRIADASAEAMFDRLINELGGPTPPPTTEQLVPKLLPRAHAAEQRTPAYALLHRTYPIVQSVLTLRRFGWPRDSVQVGDVLSGQLLEAPLPELSDATAHTGFVDLPASDDGKVRAVPLVVDYVGRLMPHMVLATACAALDVDPRSVVLTPTSVTIPLANDRPIVIPVHTIRSESFGTPGMFMELPWYGRSDYTTMFDAPAHVEPKQHLPIRNVWSAVEILQSIDRNLENADAAVTSLIAIAEGKSKADAYLKLTPSLTRAQREKYVQDALSNDFVKDNYEFYSSKPATELEEEQKELLAAYRTLLAIPNKELELKERLARRRAALREQLNGKTIMVGWAATGATDTYPSSLGGQWPGVAIMGAAVNGILTRHLWTVLPWWISAVVTLVLGMVTTLAVARFSPVPALLLSVALLSGYLALNGFVLFDRFDLLLPSAGTVSAIVLCWSGLTLARYIIESRERRRITQQFSNYVDPALVDYFIENPDQMQVDGKVREMTVVFTDLAGFTTISEKLREATVPILNEYMSLMVPIIREHSGYWDKFLGDGIMFFYNGLAPITDHAVRAIDTVIEMQIVTDRFNDRLRERQLPKVAMRAGISTGEMVVGDAGSKDIKHRANNFTVLGDAVNLGARLEGANKPIGTRILINGRTAELSDNKFLLRPVGNVRVVGKLEGVQLFEPLCRIEKASDAQKRLVELSGTVVASFADADFERCVRAAQKMEEELGSAKFSQFYLRIAREHIENTPTDFEGQILLSEK